MWSAMRATARRWMTKIVVHPAQISRRRVEQVCLRHTGMLTPAELDDDLARLDDPATLFLSPVK